MSNKNVVKKFDALVSKYGFDHGNLLDMYDIDDETNIIERTLHLIPEAKVERDARRDFQPEDGDLTAYGVVVVKCAHLMCWCLECFDGEEMVLERQRSDHDALLRKCCLAYEVYYHLNGDFLLRSVMNEALESTIQDTPFFRNARTFRHPDLDDGFYQQLVKVVSEIALLFFRYAGHLPKANKPGLKPWLLATKTKSHGWQLPSQGKSLTLKSCDEIQIIHGDAFRIVLGYGPASLVLGNVAEIQGGKILVTHQGKTIYSGDHSFAIDLDRNNLYSAAVDTWHAGGCRWVSDILMQQPKVGAIAAHTEEIEALMLEACGNLLDIALKKHSLEIYHQLYLRELSWYHFDDHLFCRFQKEFLTTDLCAQAVFENYECLRHLPDDANKDLRIGLAALNGDCFGAERVVWGLLFSHTEMPLDELAKTYITEQGPYGYAPLPPRLKTAEILQHTVKSHPDCLNYTTNNSVFMDLGGFEAFLELQEPGLAKRVSFIMEASNCTPRQAYESVLATQALEVESETLPYLDCSSFGALN